MGNEKSSQKDAFRMNIQLIGTGLTNYKNIISKKKSKYSIKNYWTFQYDQHSDVNSQINKYFDKLQQIKNGGDKTICLKETLIIKINNIYDPEFNLIIEKTNSLGQIQYMPLILVLLVNGYSKNMKLSINTQKYKRIDPRLIMVTEYNESEKKMIKKILLRLCSIHNELGDRFTIGEGEKAKDYDIIKKYHPFNINIACIGRFGQGKSTGVNAILKEYRAKESTKGSSQTKELTFYQHSIHPIRVLDIPGFEDPDTVKKAVEKFKICGDKINKIKDNLHIILYFINYMEPRSFANLEIPILEEICVHRSSKIIYVITHSNPDMDEQDKEDKIDNINEGLQGIMKNSSCFYHTQKGGMLAASKDNVVFVNFHRDNKNGFKEFGIKDLFKKIYDFFIQTEDYVNSNKTIDKNYINNQAVRLRAQAEDMLLSNKVWGGIVGIIPGVDWLLQKFVIKKNAAKKLGQIYGIDVKFLNEKENETKDKNYIPDYITASVDTEHLKMKLEGEQLIQESTAFKVGNAFKVTGEAASYIGGSVSVGTGIARAATAVSEVTSTATAAASTATTAASTATTAAVGIGSTALKVIGTGLFVVGAAVGVALGGYFTYQYCEDLINQFETYYKDNAEKIGNSYKEAAQYFLDESMY